MSNAVQRVLVCFPIKCPHRFNRSDRVFVNDVAHKICSTCFKETLYLSDPHRVHNDVLLNPSFRIESRPYPKSMQHHGEYKCHGQRTNKPTCDNCSLKGRGPHPPWQTVWMERSKEMDTLVEWFAMQRSLAIQIEIVLCSTVNASIRGIITMYAMQN